MTTTTHHLSKPMDRGYFSLSSFKPSTDALKNITENLEKEREQALQSVSIYQEKLKTRTEYAERLEKSYKDVCNRNSELRAKVASDLKTIKELKELLRTNNSRLCQVEADLRSLNGNFQSATSKKDKVVSACEKHKNRAKHLNQQLEVAQKHVKSLSEELDKATQKAAQVQYNYDEDKKAWSISKERADTKESELRSLLDSVKNDLSLAQDKNKDLLAAMKDADASYEQKISNLKSQLDEEKSAHALAVEASATLQKEIQSLADQIKELTATNAALNEDCAKHVESNNQLTVQLEALRTEFATIQESHAATNSELDSTKQQLTNLSAQLTTLQEQHDAKEQHLTSTAKELSTIKTKLADAEKAATKAAKDAERAKHASDKALAEERKRISKELDKHTAAHKIELDKIIKERDALSAALSKEKEKADKEVAALQVKLDNANYGWKDSDAKLQQANARLSAASKDLQAKESQLVAATQDNAKLVQELEDTAAKLEEKEIALQGISMYAQQQGKTGTTASAMKRTRSSHSPHHQKSSSATRRTVRFKEPLISQEIDADDIDDDDYAGDMSQKNDDAEWDDEDDDQYGDIVKNLLHDDVGIDDNDDEDDDQDGNLKSALVVPGHHHHHSQQVTYERQGPIIHEVDSDDSDSENAENLPSRTYARSTTTTTAGNNNNKTATQQKKGAGNARGGSKRGSRFTAMKRDVTHLAAGRAGGAKRAKPMNKALGGGSAMYMQGPGASFFKLFNDLQNASPDSKEVV